MVASSRLARGDASVAIGVNMHLVVVLNMVRRWRIARAAGNERREAAFAASLRKIAARRAPCSPPRISEPGQDLTRPSTRAAATDGRLARRRPQDLLHDVPGGDGAAHRRAFADEDGAERYGYARSRATRRA